MGIFLFAGYFFIKYIAYCSWCLVGLRLINPDRPRRVSAALGYGGIRLLMGFGFGVVILILTNILWPTLYSAQIPGRKAIIYLSIYVPIRLVEWSIMAAIIDPSPAILQSLVLGRTAASRLWRLGGILVSCIADIPMLIDGLPVGRFLC